MPKRNKTFLGMASGLVFTGMAFFAASPAAALPCDDLGSSWIGCEYGAACEWNFRFVRQTCNSNVWNAYWTHPRVAGFQSQITITKAGSTVTVIRPTAAGGVSCTYTGTYKVRDVTNGIPYRVSGSYTCSNGYTGPWRANIR